MEDRLPLAEAIREERTVLVSTIEDRDARYPSFRGQGQEREDHLLVCMPLKTAQQTLGGLAVSFPPG